MKVATIVPQQFLDMTRADEYHMCLAHLIGEPGYEPYTHFFKQIGRLPYTHLIMDNGLIEGNPRPIHELVTKALLVDADEIVLPDVFKDRAQTYAAVVDALQQLTDPDKGQPLRGRTSFMAVAQGASLEEWIESAKELMQLPIRTLGVPKVLCSLPGLSTTNGWLNRLEVLKAIEPYRHGTQIHLLGCWDTPLEAKMISKAEAEGVISPIRGIDSALPYVFTRAGMKMSEGGRPDSSPIDFAMGGVDRKLLKYNIDMWRHECNIHDTTKDNVQRIW
ncbi:hypothetical protein D3C71_743410 [compost metagenome]